MKMPFLKARDWELDSCQNLDKGNIVNIELGSMYAYNVCIILASEASQKKLIIIR